MFIEQATGYKLLKMHQSEKSESCMSSVSKDIANTPFEITHEQTGNEHYDKSWKFSWALHNGEKAQGGIHNTSFSLKLTNGPNNLECYITLGYNSLSGKNTLA